MQLTAVFIQVPDGYIAFVEELPGANTQGATLEEARENLRESAALVVEANRELAARALRDQVVIKAVLRPYVQVRERAARALRDQVVTKEPFELAI